MGVESSRHQGAIGCFSPRYVRWTPVTPTGHRPPQGRGYCSAVVGNSVYLYGGSRDATDTSDMWIFDTETLKWSMPGVSGESPSPRSFLSCTAIGRCIYYFGGHDDNTHVELNDMYMFDTVQRHWIKVEYDSEPPPGRYEHTMTAVDKKIYVFGGGNSQGWLNDLAVFNTVTRTWYHPRVSGQKPSKRLAHRAVAVGDRIYIFGGYTAKQSRLNDLHILNTDSHIWQQPYPNGHLPPPRAGHGIDIVDQNLYIFGGYGENGSRMNDLHIFNISSLTYSRPSIRGGDAPSPRSYHSLVSVGRRLFLFCGIDNNNELGDTWVLDLEYVGDATTPLDVPPSTVLQDYKSMVNSSKFSDISFVLSDGSRIHAHRIILSSRSKHFHAMLENGMKESAESAVLIPEISKEAFIALMEYVYTGDVSLKPGNVSEVLMIADQYGEDRLRLLCECYVEKAISNSNACEMLVTADQFNAAHLRKFCINHIVTNHSFIHGTEAYVSLPPDLREEIEQVISHNTFVRDK